MMVHMSAERLVGGSAENLVAETARPKAACSVCWWADAKAGRSEVNWAAPLAVRSVDGWAAELDVPTVERTADEWAGSLAAHLE